MVIDSWTPSESNPDRWAEIDFLRGYDSPVQWRTAKHQYKSRIPSTNYGPLGEAGRMPSRATLRATLPQNEPASAACSSVCPSVRSASAS